MRFRKFFSFLILFLSGTISNAQTGWTWESGSRLTGDYGNFGTKGIGSASSLPPARLVSAAWKDAAGSIWTFGGSTTIGITNDLWKYDSYSRQWTWISGDNFANVAGVYGTKGVPDAANKPGSRMGHQVFTDVSGNFWVYAGYGYDGSGVQGYLNDLWKYNPTTNLWTWVSGDNIVNTLGEYGVKGIPNAANKPGSRLNNTGWKDAAGNFWIFGGNGYGVTNLGILNDLWRYNPATNEWTWISGSKTHNSTGVYGTRGVPNAANIPGGRYSHVGWADAAGNFYIFGGFGFDQVNRSGLDLNDLWKYNPVTGEWTWIHGNNFGNQNGVYGTQRVADVANTPGARYGASAAVDALGNVWLFGGNGYAATGGQSELNDLWIYNPTTNEWTWHSGENNGNATGVYGTLGIGDAANHPGGRNRATCWFDAVGNFWIYGGRVQNAQYGDLWRLGSLIPLPIRKINLHGTSNAGYNSLRWETTSEENTKEFIVQRSANGTNYITVGKLAAAGSGNKCYSFKDQAVSNKTYFYRIQMADLDGKVNYSAVITLNNTAEVGISVYPNPAHTGITLKISDNRLFNTTAKLFTATGQLIGEVVIKSRGQYIDLQRYPKGVLNLQFVNGKICSVVRN